ncbi:MAG: hypothetical protein JKY15_02010 [Deltaproteobacteria bacterium]|nr:hypothetical protein [Deltaproteobacteria bacterium]
MIRIYNYNSDTDGWKQLPNAQLKTIKIDQKQRGIREYEIPLTHYFKGGKSFCGITEVEGTSFYNDTRNQCDDCREGLRAQSREAKEALERKDESVNVIDYKAAEAKDHPETAKVSH